MLINQAPTAIEHFHNPDTQARLQTYLSIVRSIFDDQTHADWTLKEIGVEFRHRTASAVPDSSLCQALHQLRRIGHIAVGPQKRPCRINGIMKQVWGLTGAYEDRMTEE